MYLAHNSNMHHYIPGLQANSGHKFKKLLSKRLQVMWVVTKVYRR